MVQHAVVDDLVKMSTKASSDLTLLQHRFHKEFLQIYPHNANSLKLVSRMKKIQEELSSLNEECRKLLSAEQLSSALRGKGNYEQWSAQESRELLKLLVDAANNGARQADGSFSKKLITQKVLPALNSKLRCNKTYDHVRSKLKVWKRTYTPIAKLMATNSGFGWDPLTQKITASDKVWDAYLVVHPDAVNYRVKVFEDFDDLKTVVGQGSIVSSKNTQVSKVGFDTSPRLDGIMVGEEVPEGGDVFVAHTPSQEPANQGDVNVAHTSSQEPANQCTTSSVRRKRRYDEATSLLQRAPAVESTELIAESLAGLAVKMKVLNSRSVIHNDWLKAVNEIPDLEEELRFRAGGFLNTPEFKEQFIGMDVETRRRFLRWRSELGGRR
ncbi:uncharacterized protein At2g29880-like [Tasmannia lanceolata]|uniref:uncharacterized protein At2g29880-like n=1 Tax=Tasmannia lanceolata TaxID=3420 RepID=UPI004063C730